MARAKKARAEGPAGPPEEAKPSKLPGEPCKSPPESTKLDTFPALERVSAEDLPAPLEMDFSKPLTLIDPDAALLLAAPRRPRLGPPTLPQTATLQIARPAWEYLVRFLAGDPSRALTEVGLEGWELVFCREASEQLRVDGVPTWCKGIYGVFKRPAIS